MPSSTPKLLLIRLFILALSSSCKKDPEPAIQLEGSYETSNTIVPGPIQFYTTGGRRITDQQAIQSFIRRNRVNDYFLFNTQTITDGSSIELMFQPADKVALLFKQPNQPTQTIDTEITAKSREHLTLANIIESRFSKTTNNPGNYCGALGDKIKNVYPVLTCQDLPPASGYSSTCTGRQVRVLLLKNGKPVLTLMSWVASASRSGSRCSLAYYNEWNTFNTSLPAQLVGGDTIMVQANEVALNKK